MLNIDRVWQRVKHHPLIKSARLDAYRFVAIGKQFNLTTAQTSAATPVEFPAGAVILAITAGLSVATQLGTQAIRDLSGVRVSIDYPAADGSLITGGRMNGGAIWGLLGDRQFPAKEVVVPINSTLNVTVQNLTTSTIDFDILFHCLVFKAASA